MHKKLLFISSANLTTNPRLAKELKLAVSSGYKDDFVGFRMDNFLDNGRVKTRKNFIENI